MRTPSARTHRRPFSRVLLGTAAVGGGLLLTALPASAHVGIGAGDYHAGGYAILPFSVPHGCDGSPTTKVRIQLPESVPTVTPTVNPNWDIELVKETLDTPIDLGEGRTLTERITEVAYTAKAPLPNEYRDVFELSLKLPDDAAGTSLAFPVIQECVEGQTDWTQIAAEGQDPEELEHPAPAIEVEASEGDAHGGGASDEDEDTATTAASSDDHATADTDSDADADSGNGLAVAGLVTGIAGILLGGGALVASRGKGGASS